MASRSARLSFAWALLCSTVLSGALQAEGEKRLSVAVSLPPQVWLVEQLGGDAVDAWSLLQPGDGPETYQPTDSEVTRAARADLLVLIGVPFERGAWARALRKSGELRVVEPPSTEAALVPDPLEQHEEAPPVQQAPTEDRPHEDHHNHGDEEHHDHADTSFEEDREGDAHDGEHDTSGSVHEEEQGDHHHAHDENAEEHGDHAHDKHHEHDSHGDHGHVHDPHVWLSPRRLIPHAEDITEALVALLPGRRAELTERLTNVRRDLHALHREIESVLAAGTDRPFLVHHPSWTTFAEDFGVRQLAIETRGHEPSDSELSSLLRVARSEGVKVLFIQPGFAGASRHAVAAALGARIEILDPLPSDLPSGLLEVARRIAASGESL
ncbi:MAG: zinc ABC transporter substrate-binding protein [Acidobacteriota bacterium]